MTRIRFKGLSYIAFSALKRSVEAIVSKHPSDGLIMGFIRPNYKSIGRKMRSSHRKDGLPLEIIRRRQRCVASISAGERRVRFM
jgi:hypothetical protein